MIKISKSENLSGVHTAPNNRHSEPGRKGMALWKFLNYNKSCEEAIYHICKASCFDGWVREVEWEIPVI